MLGRDAGHEGREQGAVPAGITAGLCAHGGPGEASGTASDRTTHADAHPTGGGSPRREDSPNAFQPAAVPVLLTGACVPAAATAGRTPNNPLVFAAGIADRSLKRA